MCGTFPTHILKRLGSPVNTPWSHLGSSRSFTLAMERT